MNEISNIYHLLVRGAERTPKAIRFSEKKAGVWMGTDNATLLRQVQHLGRFLRERGLEPGERCAILGQTCQCWALCDLAVYAVAGVSVPIYPNLRLEDIAYIIDNSRARILCLQSQEHLVEVEAARRAGGMPSLRAVLTFNTIGTLIGETHENSNPFPGEVSKREDLATIVYTSGTTGPPKGAMLTHGNLLAEQEGLIEWFDQIERGDEPLSLLTYLPLAHMIARSEVYAGLFHDLRVHFASALEALATELLEIEPSILVAVPRVFEKVYEKIHDQIRCKSRLQRAIFSWAKHLGLRTEEKKETGERLRLNEQVQLALADRLVYRTIRSRFGSRFRFAILGGAPFPPVVHRFFAACGLTLLEGYGLTEVSALSHGTRFGEVRVGTVGKPLRSITCRFDSDGEILLCGPTVFLGYYANPEATASAFDGAWFRTGDVGRLDCYGNLVITDRKKDLIITSQGKNIAPQNVEQVMSRSPLIEQFLCFGDRHKYLTGMIVPNVLRLSERLGCNLGTLPDWHLDTRVQKVIQTEVERLNQQLNRFEQIKAFLVVPEPFTVENSLMTPTMKIRRRAVYQKYQKLLEALYTAEEIATSSTSIIP